MSLNYTKTPARSLLRAEDLLRRVYAGIGGGTHEQDHHGHYLISFLWNRRRMLNGLFLHISGETNSEISEFHGWEKIKQTRRSAMTPILRQPAPRIPPASMRILVPFRFCQANGTVKTASLGTRPVPSRRAPGTRSSNPPLPTSCNYKASYRSPWYPALESVSASGIDDAIKIDHILSYIQIQTSPLAWHIATQDIVNNGIDARKREETNEPVQAALAGTKQQIGGDANITTCLELASSNVGREASSQGAKKKLDGHDVDPEPEGDQWCKRKSGVRRQLIDKK
ncbi:hypothetical protein BKA70DRAFT_1238329 [Coprinopsis sp. MPI-PUGE-AT-0042]|nr:hypothetical protein BKA70DRAFT_1238329 [Coprinopsis sp. MPI-PUGE-AT-0042]